MKNLEKIPIDSPLHFIGVGGAGMSPMAIIMREKGYTVSGSDLAETKNISLLKEKNVKVFCGEHNASHLPSQDNAIVVASSAISAKNPELSAATKRALKIFSRGEFLAKIADSYKQVIAVGGSHGKTTITAMITYCLKNMGFSPGFMIGGKVNDWEYSGAAGDGSIFVTESDESDGTNKFMNATIAIVSNLDDDHVWNFAGEEELFANFAKFAVNSKTLIYGKSELADKIFALHKNKKGLDFSDTNSMPVEFSKLAAFQKFNALLAAHAVSSLTGIALQKTILAIKDFPGVARRHSIRFKNENFTLIEDYAHHPTELSALIDSLVKMKTNDNIHIVFQPHRYARLKKYFDRFVCELRRVDKVTVLPVFSAWCSNDKINSRKLVDELNKAKGENFAIFADENFAGLSAKLAKGDGRTEILAIVGAGDCDKLVEEIVKNRRKSK